MTHPINRLLRPYFWFFVFCYIFLSCTKEDKNEPKEAVSGFETEVFDRRFQKNSLSLVCQVDSAFYFRNLSSGGKGVVYHWDFGDGSESSLFSPKHIFATSGNYRVRLTVTLPSGAYAISEKELSVIAGQKRIELNGNYDTGTYDIVEGEGGSLALFCWSRRAGDFSGPKNAGMVTLDRDLRQVRRVDFPAGFRISAALAADAGNFIVLGSSVGKTINNELIKIGPAGAVIWTREISSGINFEAVLSTADGYLINGTSKGGNGENLTILVKTDLSGAVIWSKEYEGMEACGNVTADGDTFLAAGVKKSANLNCNSCDSLSIMRIDRSGAVIRRTNTLLNATTVPISRAYLSFVEGKAIAVAISATRSLLTYSSSLAPQLQTNVIYEIAHMGMSAGGDILLLQREYTNGFRATYTGLDLNGARKWGYTVDGSEFFTGGYRCCNNSQGIKTRPLQKGGSVFIADETASSGRNVAMVTKIAENGRLM